MYLIQTFFLKEYAGQKEIKKLSWCLWRIKKKMLKTKEDVFGCFRYKIIIWALWVICHLSNNILLNGWVENIAAFPFIWSVCIHSSSIWSRYLHLIIMTAAMMMGHLDIRSNHYNPSFWTNKEAAELFLHVSLSVN